MLEEYCMKGRWAKTQAAQLTKDNASALAELCHGTTVEEIDAVDETVKSPGINVPTPDGRQRLSEGDFLINWDGFWFVGKPGWFHDHFEKI